MEQIFEKGRNVVQLGSIEYIKGYGVIARKQNTHVRTFLTHGYRADVGSEDCTGLRIQTVKKLARNWIHGTAS